MDKIRVIDYNPVFGFVDYGEVDLDKNGGYCAKMRCKRCGAAWIDINHLDGHFTCPNCGTSKKGHIMSVE